MQTVGLVKKLDRLLGPLAAALLARVHPLPSRGSMPHELKSVLFIRPGGIGDAVLLTPVIHALKKVFPHVTVELLVERRNHAVFGLCSEVDRIFCYDRPKELFAVLRRSYDVVIDTEQWYRLSAVVTRLVRSPMKVGFATNERCRMFTHPVPCSQDCYEAECFFRLLGPLGIAGDVMPAGETLRVSNDARQQAASMLSDALQQPVLALFPSASIPEKRWDLEKFRKLVAWCANHGLQVVILGGRHDRALGGQIAEGQKVLNLAGLTSIAESAAVLEQAAVVVSGDSGLLHLASLLGRPTVSLFGPSNATKWAPSGPDHIVLNKNLPCSPCTRFGNMPKCPIGVRCLQEITAEEVMVAVMTLLHRNAGRMTTDVPKKCDQEG